MLVSILTATHRLTGELSVGDQRLSDHVNSKLESVLRLTNATVARAQTPDVTVEDGATVVVQKRSSLVVIEQSENPALAPHLHTKVAKRQHDLLILVGSIEVRGSLHTNEALDVLGIQRFLTSGGSFVPVTNAVVSVDADPAHDLEQSFAMVNLQEIRSIVSPSAEAEEGFASRP